MHIQTNSFNNFMKKNKLYFYYTTNRKVKSEGFVNFPQKICLKDILGVFRCFDEVSH